MSIVLSSRPPRTAVVALNEYRGTVADVPVGGAVPLSSNNGILQGAVLSADGGTITLIDPGIYNLIFTLSPNRNMEALQYNVELNQTDMLPRTITKGTDIVIRTPTAAAIRIVNKGTQPYHIDSGPGSVYLKIQKY